MMVQVTPSASAAMEITGKIANNFKLTYQTGPLVDNEIAELVNGLLISKLEDNQIKDILKK